MASLEIGGLGQRHGPTCARWMGGSVLAALVGCALLVSGCGAASGHPEDQSTRSATSATHTPPTADDRPSTTTTTPVATTTTPVATTTIAADPSTTLPPGPIVLETSGPVTVGVRDGETLFTVTHDPSAFADLVMTRQPDGVLVSLGWRSGAWQVHEPVRGDAHSPGDYLQVEVHRLWPTDEAMDVLWLTDYSGVTRDTLTGFTPEPSDTFTLFDVLILEGRLDRFGLHSDCRAPEGDIAAALLSFEGGTPVPLMAWVIDLEVMQFVEVNDPTAFGVGRDCGDPRARG